MTNNNFFRRCNRVLDRANVWTYSIHSNDNSIEIHLDNSSLKNSLAFEKFDLDSEKKTSNFFKKLARKANAIAKKRN